ncbi:hypothetical protein V2A60_004013 [Cordyceps javanica]
MIKQCYKHHNITQCIQTSQDCTAVGGPYELNPYDMRKQCVRDLTNMCYEGVNYVTHFLNQPSVMAALGVEVQSWTSCSDSMDKAFHAAGDGIQPIYRHVNTVSEEGMPVLWSGRGGFNRAQTRKLTLGSSDAIQVYGILKHTKGLAFARMFKAGHLVPMDQPRPILDLVHRWVDGEFRT